jgi:hypothetical protein
VKKCLLITLVITFYAISILAQEVSDAAHTQKTQQNTTATGEEQPKPKPSRRTYTPALWAFLGFGLGDYTANSKWTSEGTTWLVVDSLELTAFILCQINKPLSSSPNMPTSAFSPSSTVIGFMVFTRLIEAFSAHRIIVKINQSLGYADGPDISEDGSPWGLNFRAGNYYTTNPGTQPISGGWEYKQNTPSLFVIGATYKIVDRVHGVLPFIGLDFFYSERRWQLQSAQNSSTLYQTYLSESLKFGVDWKPQEHMPISFWGALGLEMDPLYYRSELATPSYSSPVELRTGVNEELGIKYWPTNHFSISANVEIATANAILVGAHYEF